MNAKEKKKLFKQIDDKTQVISHPTSVYSTFSIWVNGIPKGLFSTWREDCKKIYNDIYWAKIWSDHLKAQAYDVLINSSVQQAEPEKVSAETEPDENELALIGNPYEGMENGGKGNGKRL